MSSDRLRAQLKSNKLKRFQSGDALASAQRTPILVMNLHIVNCTKLCPIHMSEDAAVDDQVGVALRRASSPKIWVTNPSVARPNPQQRLNIVAENRADVIGLLLECLDAGLPGRAPHRMATDEGAQPAPAA